MHADDSGQPVDVAKRVATSVILEGLVRDAPTGHVTLEWIIANLRERSFGIVMLLVALVGLVPGASSLIGILLAIPAIQMFLGRNETILPSGSPLEGFRRHGWCACSNA